MAANRKRAETMFGTIFVGRQQELETLKLLTKKRQASLVVIKGRRRIGKSRLALEFAKRSKGYNSYYFTGLPPEQGISAQKEREDFADQLAKEFSIPKPRADDWNTLFWTLADRVKRGKNIVILDEINWLGAKDPTFLAKLKSAWDRDFSISKDLIIILSGSLTGWIDKNILHSTGFVGRINLDITLGELPLIDAKEFWNTKKTRITPIEILRILSVTGGIPRYLEEVDFGRSAEDNLRRLCYTPSGLLYREFDDLFDDLFVRRNAIYRDIIQALANKPLDLDGLHNALGKKKTGHLSNYVDDLEKCGFIARDFTWKLSDGEESKLSRIRVCDNYLRFYIKAIKPKKGRIKRGMGEILPPIDNLLGLQFENVLLNNRQVLWSKVGISPNQIVCENPFFQRQTKRQKGCQIDYMIQTKKRTLYIFEFKFKNGPIEPAIIGEVQQKISRIAMPRYFSYRPVLVHVNGVSESVIDKEYFDEIIDFGDLLTT